MDDKTIISLIMQLDLSLDQDGRKKQIILTQKAYGTETRLKEHDFKLKTRI